ncbi:RNA methyltransferase [Coprinopsis marcescibilis]|uniref:RNA methyltransferase n=1 Tax=Coprinopsis marcescibilis TaxID=230819 RepID=A0A5C3LP88_COPMA|nr:RNA methyltransferase [Coprinopsis marcescibilis]
MGKAQKKTGKGRLDKYYKLAKEQGYRARSAFKLIQLNKKYSFLESARCTIDLCAAPGGWLQVSSKYMPPNSLIIGVDLDPIKPIPRVITFAADITTTHCRNLLRNEMKDWKADVVLHDGAPNVGTAWIQDAFSQSELVLMSLKLAVEFLIKGGTFVTKVFRSVDYNSLLWVFNQLFGKVEATKPPSSRNVSAEIFVVCREFLAPKFIDPKFLDPKHVFKDPASLLSVDGPSVNDTQANVFHPEKKRRHRSGYADNDYTLFHTVSATKFIREPEPIALLGTYNKITFETEEEKEWLNLEITKSDIKSNCDDLKVLGKGDFKALLKWRLNLREDLGIDVSAKNVEDATEVVDVTEVVDEEQQLSEELERLNAETAARLKRERRKTNEIRTRTIQRMQLKMTAPLDIGLEQTDASLNLGQEDIFDMEHTNKLIRGKQQSVFWTDNDGDVVIDDEEEGGSGSEDDEEEEGLDTDEERERKVAQLEGDIDNLYDAYQERLRDRDLKYKTKESRKKNAQREEWDGVAAKDSDDDSDSEESEGGWEIMENQKANDDDSSSDSSSDESDDEENPESNRNKRRRATDPKTTPKTKKQKVSSNPVRPSVPAASHASSVWFKQDLFKGVGDLDVSDDGMESESEQSEGDANAMEVDEVQYRNSDSEDDDFEVVPQDNSDDETMWDVDNENEDEAKRSKVGDRALLTAEAVTLAQMLVNRQTTKTELINDGFNRYSLNAKDGLPGWFLEEEAKHYKANIPITKEAVDALRAKQRALDARPIKKVAEAKARKKFKAAQRLDKAMKKAEGVISTTDMTEREKAQQIVKLMAKGSAKKREHKEVKVVVARGSTRGVKGRPKGVKGRYLMVDSRMKKELRAKKRKDKANRKRSK